MPRACGDGHFFMNRRMVLYTVGNIITIEAGLLLLPAAVALFYRETAFWAFLLTSAIALLLGLCAKSVSRPRHKTIYAREGFAIVAFAWIGLSLVGALPFFLSREIPNYADAFFETVSGFTTTGASVVPDPAALSCGIQFWRFFTHWIGGMGVLVFIVAIMPNVADRSIHILRAEMPGHTMGKLVPRLKDTAKILYLIYIGMTVIEFVFLLCGGMTPFEAILHSFGTAGTGGFGLRVDSIGSYSPYIQWIIAVFMLLFGINFNLYYMFLIRRFRAAFGSRELHCYLAAVAVSVAVISVDIYPRFASASESIRQAFFQVSSVITTTGFSTSDFNLWPQLSKAILFLLMFVGGCAGSTAGGLKFSRLMILCKMIRRELHRMAHPRTVSTVRFEGKSVDDATLHSVAVYFGVYTLCIAVVFFAISFEPFDFETDLSAAVACFNNIGPGFGAVGAAGSYAGYTSFSKLILSAAMLMGRLEIFPILITFTPSIWRRK